MGAAVFPPCNLAWGQTIVGVMLVTVQFSSVQSLCHVWLFATPWIAARQASLPITNSRSLPKLMSIVSVMPPNHLILCHPLLLLPSIFPSIRVFSNELAIHIRWPSIGTSASASILTINTQNWFPLVLTGLISLLHRDSQESSPTSQLFSALILFYLPVLFANINSSLLFLPSIFPSISVFSNEFFTSGGQSTGASASALVLKMNIQDWFL